MQSLDDLMPSIFSQQKDTWRYGGLIRCSPALCALWQVYWRLQYGQCLQKYVVYAKCPEELYSVSSTSKLSDENHLSKLSDDDAVTWCVLRIPCSSWNQAMWSIRVCMKFVQITNYFIRENIKLLIINHFVCVIMQDGFPIESSVTLWLIIFDSLTEK